MIKAPLQLSQLCCQFGDVLSGLLIGWLLDEGLGELLKVFVGLGSMKLRICLSLFELFFEKISLQEKILNEIIEGWDFIIKRYNLDLLIFIEIIEDCDFIIEYLSGLSKLLIFIDLSF